MSHPDGSLHTTGVRHIYLIILQNTLFIQSISSAALTFLFVNLALFDNDEVGAKVFFLLVSSAIYGILPGGFILILMCCLVNFLSYLQDSGLYMVQKSCEFLVHSTLLPSMV